MTVAITIAASLIVAVLAFLLGRSMGSAAGKAVGEREVRTVRDELSEADRRLAVAESRNVAYGEAEKLLKDTFSALAGSALSSNSEQFLQRAEERFKNLQGDTTAELDKRKVAIENLIAPLDKSLKNLDSKVAELEARRIEAYAEVKTQISELANGTLRRKKALSGGMAAPSSISQILILRKTHGNFRLNLRFWLRNRDQGKRFVMKPGR